MDNTRFSPENQMEGEISRLLAEFLSEVEGMGLVRVPPSCSAPDFMLLRQVLDRLAEEGVGRQLIFQVKTLEDLDHLRLRSYLRAIKSAVEESPLPRYEWPALIETLGSEELSALVGAAPSSIARYAKGERSTPDDVADRLHFLALLVGYLRGAYNDMGIRRWFHRPRTALKGCAPKELLEGDWSPSDPGPAAVGDLARSLLSAGVT